MIGVVMKKIGCITILIWLVTACSIGAGQNFIDTIDIGKNSWNGITLGDSTSNDLVEMLQTHPDVPRDSIVNTNQPWQIFDEMIWFDMNIGSIRQSDIYGVAGILERKVVSIDFCGQFEDTIGSVTDIAGKPSNIIVTEGGEVGGYLVGVIHRESGLYYWYHTAYQKDVPQTEIRRNIQLECFSIFKPSLYEDLLKIGIFSQGNYSGEETKSIMYAWDGYGEINEKYPFREP
jgi:hypothetical protein